MLQIENLSVSLKQENTYLPVLDNLSLKIESGQVLALIGESGCGKSMTALSIMRLLPSNSAYSNASQIYLHGKNLIDLPESDMCRVRGCDIGMIFQDPATCLNPVLSIGVQITEVLKRHQKLSGRECYIEALKLLELVRIPDAVQRFDNYPHQLSGGMKQRVMIAIALASRPSLLIADEPTTALDVTTQAEILSLISDLRRKYNMAILLITHNLAVAAQMADTIAVMRSGKIIETSSSERFFNAPQQEYSRQLLDSVPCEEKKSKFSASQYTETILTVKDLQIYFKLKTSIFGKKQKQIKAVDGVDLALMQGETLAIVGESGCGKTTVAKALVGLQETTSGSIDFAGQNIANISNKKWQAIRKQMQIIFQDPFAALDPKRRVCDSLEEGMRALCIELSISERAARIDNLLLKVGINPQFKFRFPHQFSGGERQRICIARALSVQPKVIVCDEPTSSLDVSIQIQVLKLLQQLQTDENLSYIFISHDLAVVRYLADRIVVMYLGRIVEMGPAVEVLNNPKHPYTQMLLAAVPKINPSQKITHALNLGEVPSPSNPPAGCHFHPRCKYAKAECRIEYPKTRKVSKWHCVACILYTDKSTD